MKASDSRKKLEGERADLLRHAESHDREGAIARTKLVEIQAKRNERDHLERVLARDSAAVRADEKLAAEQATIEREISSRAGLAADSRRKIAALDPQIESGRISEAIELVQEQAEAAEKFCKDAVPQFSNLASSIAGIQSRAIALVTVLRALPASEQQKLRAFIDTLPALFGPAVLSEVTAALRAAGISAPHVPQGDKFRDIVGTFFSDLKAALETLAATRTGAPGRVRYRALTNVAGGRSGISLRVGDVVALDPSDVDTKNLLSTAAIAPIDGETKPLGSAA